MKIVIVGEGKIGSTLVDQLTRENHDVTVIDINPKVIAEATSKYDVAGICGNGASYAVLQQAGVEKADLLIATTSLDERNILCCLTAKQLGVSHAIARIRTPEYAAYMKTLQQSLRLSMHINPELETAAEISRILRFPSATKVSPFMFDRVEMVESKLHKGNPLIGMPLYKLKATYNDDVLICAVTRGDQSFIPNGGTVLEEEDRITIIASPKVLNTFIRKVNPSVPKIRNVMILGGGRISFYLTRQLTDMGIQVKIIDSDEEQCQMLASQLPGASIIHGNARDRELMQEEGLQKMDAFIALTGMDEENIIASMYADSCEVPKVITKISDTDMSAMMYKLGLDIAVSPKTIAADTIVRYVRAMANSEENSMKTLYTICQSEVEVMEFHVDGDLPFLGVPLAQLNLRPQTLIGCVIRGMGQPIIAGGSTTIEKNDTVIVVSGQGVIKDLTDILA